MKKFLLLVLVSITLMTLSANGTKEENEIVFWHSLSGSAADSINEIVASYNKTNDKNIVVEAVYQGSANDVLNKVMAASNTNDVSNLPSLVQLDSTGVVSMVNNPYLISVQELSNGDYDFLIDSAIDGYLYKDELIALAFNASTIMFYYNKTLFDSLNIGEIKTIDDFIKVAPSLVSSSMPYALTLVPATYELCTFIGAQNGLSYITDNENGHQGLPTKSVFYEEGTLTEFLTKWKELSDTGVISSESNKLDSFLSQKSATLVESTSKLSSVLNTASFEVGAAPLFCVNENSTTEANLSGGALFAFENGKEALTWDFMKYLTSKEVQLKFHLDTGYLPVNKASYEMSEYKEHIAANPLYKVASDIAFSSDLLGLWIPNGYETYYAIQSNVKALMNSELDVDQAAKNIRDGINNALSEFSSKI